MPHDQGAGRPCPGGHDCCAGPVLEAASSDQSSSIGHVALAAVSLGVIGRGWAHSDPASCPHGAEQAGIWIELDDQFHPILAKPPRRGDYLVCRGCGTDLTDPTGADHDE